MRRKKSGERSDEERYYGKDGVTKSRALGVVILMGALLLFQFLVFLNKEKREKSPEEGGTGEQRQQAEAKEYLLFKFNPNSINLDSLILLGFTQRQAQVLLNYRAGGGRFKKREDFAKVYSVSKEMYERLYDYIIIPGPVENPISTGEKNWRRPAVEVAAESNPAGGQRGRHTLEQIRETLSRKREMSKPWLVELNGADSAELVMLYGIGGYYAKKIIEYRLRVGNFYSAEQLMEIRGIDSLRYAGFKDNIVVDSTKVCRFSLDTASARFLSYHPYIGRYLARGIILYRQRFGAERCTLENLEKEGLVTEEAGRRLSHYIIEK